MRQPEARLHKRIRETLKKTVGGWWMKVWQGPFSPAGTPDIIGCCEGLFFAFEVKEGKNKLEPIQEETLRRIIEDGKGVAAEIRSPEQAVSIVLKAVREQLRLLSAARRRFLSKD